MGAGHTSYGSQRDWAQTFVLGEKVLFLAVTLLGHRAMGGERQGGWGRVSVWPSRPGSGAQAGGGQAGWEQRKQPERQFSGNGARLRSCEASRDCAVSRRRQAALHSKFQVGQAQRHRDRLHTA